MPASNTETGSGPVAAKPNGDSSTNVPPTVLKDVKPPGEGEQNSGAPRKQRQRQTACKAYTSPHILLERRTKRVTRALEDLNQYFEDMNIFPVLRRYNQKWEPLSDDEKNEDCTCSCHNKRR